MGYLRSFCLVITALILGGCSVRYTERIPGVQPGYVDNQLGQDTYQVKIGEAWPKDWADLEKFALYRASDITVSKNQRYFRILNSSTQISTYYFTTPASTTTSSTASISGNTAYITSNSVSSPSVTAPISGGWYILDFRIVTNDEEMSKGRIVDAQRIMKDYQYFIDGRR